MEAGKSHKVSSGKKQMQSSEDWAAVKYNFLTAPPHPHKPPKASRPLGKFGGCSECPKYMVILCKSPSGRRKILERLELYKTKVTLQKLSR